MPQSPREKVLTVQFYKSDSGNEPVRDWHKPGIFYNLGKVYGLIAQHHKENPKNTAARPGDSKEKA